MREAGVALRLASSCAVTLVTSTTCSASSSSPLQSQRRAVVIDGERRAIPLYRNVRHVTGTVLVVGVVDELFTTHDDLFDNIVMEVDTLTANKKTGLTMMKMALSTVSTVSTVPFAGPQSLK